MSRQQRAASQVPLPRRRPDREPSAAVDQGALVGQAGGRVGDEPGLLDQVTAEDRTPVFAGYEDERYQQHDASIEALVARFNEDKAGFIGATPEQALGIGDLDPALVKSWLIQETGGGDKRSTASWEKDPAQVNVPGDWGAEKGDAWMNLTKPRRRNEGDTDTNLQAAITYLARKGFSTAGKAPKDLLGGQEFGGWDAALENYNGRGQKMAAGGTYKEAYAARIAARAAKPDVHQPIQLGPLAPKRRARK